MKMRKRRMLHLKMFLANKVSVSEYFDDMGHFNKDDDNAGDSDDNCDDYDDDNDYDNANDYDNDIANDFDFDSVTPMCEL